jgi:DNA repair protein RadC
MMTSPGKSCCSKGAGKLSDSELLAILINTGMQNLSAVDVAKALLQSTNNDLQKLATLSVKELVKKK